MKDILDKKGTILQSQKKTILKILVYATQFPVIFIIHWFSGTEHFTMKVILVYATHLPVIFITY